VRTLARLYGLNRATVRKWKERDSVEDRQQRPHELHATLTPAQETVVLAIRETLELPLDDLLVVVREFICPELSRSALARMLRRHKVPTIRELRAQRQAEEPPAPKGFKPYEPGYLHVDVKYLPVMPDETRRRYLFVAIDRATRWVYVEVLPNKSAATAAGFLKRLLKAAPMKVHTVLTDNGKEFTDRFCATGERKPTGGHAVDPASAEARVEHRLIPPRRPQTNGMVERFHARISEVLATHRYRSGEDLKSARNATCACTTTSCPKRPSGTEHRSKP
jgi:transposase InsO family protein